MAETQPRWHNFQGGSLSHSAGGEEPGSWKKLANDSSESKAQLFLPGAANVPPQPECDSLYDLFKA